MFETRPWYVCRCHWEMQVRFLVQFSRVNLNEMSFLTETTTLSFKMRSTRQKLQPEFSRLLRFFYSDGLTAKDRIKKHREMAR